MLFLSLSLHPALRISNLLIFRLGRRLVQIKKFILHFCHCHMNSETGEEKTDEHI